jgi:hypothetical protein
MTARPLQPGDFIPDFTPGLITPIPKTDCEKLKDEIKFLKDVINHMMRLR